MNCFPKHFRGMVEEDSSIQQSVGVRRGGTEGNQRCVPKSCWMSERCVWAIFTFPILRCPMVVIKIADTTVIGSDPIITWQDDIEDVIHILIDDDIGVEKYTGFVAGQLESS